MKEPPIDLFEIDMTQLAEAWVGFPRQFYVFAKRYAESKDRVDRAEAKLKLIEAELDMDIRKSPTRYNLHDKITEKIVNSIVIHHQEFQKALRKVQINTHTMRLLQAIVQTMETKKKAMECLVDLHGQNYFSVPKAKSKAAKNVTDQWEKEEVRQK